MEPAYAPDAEDTAWTGEPNLSLDELHALRRKHVHVAILFGTVALFALAMSLWHRFDRSDIVDRLLTTRSCEGCDPARTNLAGANLSGVNLRHATLKGADLSVADLSHADLRYADLSGASLYRANLSGADLRGANLAGTHLLFANLSGAMWAGLSRRVAERYVPRTKGVVLTEQGLTADRGPQ